MLPVTDTAVEVLIAGSTICRGAISTELQSKQYAAALRRAMDARIAGNGAIDSIHVFAAVPVSVAFRIGQVLAHTSLPKAYVYNFDSATTPRYCWRLCLQDAAIQRQSVDVLGRK